MTSIDIIEVDLDYSNFCIFSLTREVEIIEVWVFDIDIIEVDVLEALLYNIT